MNLWDPFILKLLLQITFSCNKNLRILQTEAEFAAVAESFHTDPWLYNIPWDCA